MILKDFLAVCCNAKVFSKIDGSIKCVQCGRYLDPLTEIKLIEPEEIIVLVAMDEDGNPTMGYEGIRDALREFKGKNVKVTIKENQ